MQNRIEKIETTTFKIMSFDNFPFEEMKKIIQLLETINYKATLIGNGNIVLQKEETQ